jgi:hypothetical protein
MKSILNLGINDIKTALSSGSEKANENRTHLANTYSELQGIHDDTPK